MAVIVMFAAFGERAQGYDEGWRGPMHHQIADRAADLALNCVPAPRRILDVGCGTGYLLGRLAARGPAGRGHGRDRRGARHDPGRQGRLC